MDESVIFSPFSIHGVSFKNRILRSSIGGRMSNYDGTVTDVWKNFEKRFADGGVAGIISTTFHVNEDRVSPLQYPSLARAKHLPHLRKHIAGIRRDQPDCRYIVQIGDPGYCTYTSLFPEAQDAKSSSGGFDPAFGYSNLRTRMTVQEIERAIRDYADAAGRVQEAGADGLEITITKGYLVHQFLNPGINRRSDDWGGDADRRFRFLEHIVHAVRRRVGADYLFGVRLSGADFNYEPLQLSLFRIPSILSSRDVRLGNGRETMLGYAKRLRDLGIDFLHVVSGYGFPNPHDTPGRFPFDEIRIFYNSTRHLSFKACLRSALLNSLPAPVGRWLFNLGWKTAPGINLEFAQAFRQATGLPVIVNGGFQSRLLIERSIGAACDMVSMARPLIANPELLTVFQSGRDLPDNPCTFCNRCVGRTPTSPLGCYDESRFPSHQAMVEQILAWNRPDPADAV